METTPMSSSGDLTSLEMWALPMETLPEESPIKKRLINIHRELGAHACMRLPRRKHTRQARYPALYGVEITSDILYKGRIRGWIVGVSEDPCTSTA